MPEPRPDCGNLPRNWIHVLALVLALLAPASGHASDEPLPPAVTRATGTLEPVGTGQLRWFGLRVYEATLWTRDGHYRDGDRPFALAIRYQRDIESTQLVETTLEEMQRFGIDEQRMREWKPRLAAVFPDVQSGDRIIGVALPDRRARFVLERGGDGNGRAEVTGEIDDDAFTATFFDIWLDENTSERDLRRALVEG